MSSMPKIDFWFDFASTYSYLTIQRIGAVAGEAGVDVAWRPFLLGPVFAAQGWNTSPFSVYPAKGEFMFRDMERRAAAYGLPFARHGKLPANSVAAARLAIAALRRPQGRDFCRRVSFAHWGEGRSIEDEAVLVDCATAAGLAPDDLAAEAAQPSLKPILRAETETAQSLGVFGAPSFTVGEGDALELFWGDDQLEQAISWAKTGAL